MVAARNRPLMTLMLGHLTIDSYAGILPILFPALALKFDLDLATVGLLALAYSGMGAISQPFFGMLADRLGTRYIGLTLIWTALTYATIGFANSLGMLLFLAAASGLGSGAYHPMGAMNANAVINSNQRHSAMAIYSVGGTLGFAIGPLLGVLLLAGFGLRGTAVMAIPGLLIATFLLIRGKTIAVQTRPRGQAGVKLPPIPVLAIGAVIGVMMLRSWTMSSIQAFVPTWYKSLGYGESFYGPLATTIVLCSALGTIGSGALADRYGTRTVIVVALVLTVPIVILFAQFPGPIAFVTGGILGLLAASAGPLLLVAAQQLMSGRTGTASGMVLGLGFVTGAIGVPITGAVADNVGIQTAMTLLVFLIIIAIPVALCLPKHQRQSPATS